MVKLYIKNMVCSRCIMVVKATLNEIGIDTSQIELGEVFIEKELDKTQRNKVEAALNKIGFELLDDRKNILIESIKIEIIQLIQSADDNSKVKRSNYLSQKLHHDYSYLSTLFSEVEGITIEQYFIAQKIEKVKELLVYDELTLSQIADQLNYSSIAHLSTQFKKVTGLTPTHFKKIKGKKRKPLDGV